MGNTRCVSVFFSPVSKLSSSFSQLSPAAIANLPISNDNETSSQSHSQTSHPPVSIINIANRCIQCTTIKLMMKHVFSHVQTAMLRSKDRELNNNTPRIVLHKEQGKTERETEISAHGPCDLHCYRILHQNQMHMEI